MGPPRVKPPRPPSRSRFHEGSMNDRASAAPPVQFLGISEERAVLEHPVPMAFEAPSYPYPTQQPHLHQPQPQQQDSGPQKLANKRSSRLLGQMWDGVWGRLGFRRDPGSEEQSKPAASKKRIPAPEPEEPPAVFGKDDRPSREEILANYHQLVASGFFSAHAIQSTRRPGPGSENNHPPQPSRAAPPAPPFRPSSSHKASEPTPSITLIPQPAPSSPPSWPLTPTSHRHAAAGARSPGTATAMPMTHPSSPICAPNSAASSRGTKRAADSDNDDEEMRQLTPRKLRKSASRDMAALPRLRNVASGRNILSRRSFSTAGTNAGMSSASGPPGHAQPQREPAKLTKRVLARLPGQRTLDMPIRRSSTRRNVSECQQQPQMQAAVAAAPLTNVSTRILRSRKSATEPMRVVPDANRGIPHVPAIPEKFTYGEDRENGGPWRGLRW